MKFDWKNALRALVVAAAILAVLAMLICSTEGYFIGTIISGIMACIWVFIAAGLIGGRE